MSSIRPENRRLDDFGGLLDWERLDPWIQANALPGEGPVTSVRRLAGGTQNHVFRIERSGVPFVLRRPPRTLGPFSNRTIAREAQVLGALAGTAVPAPRLFASCDDDSIIGSHFYVMSAVSGFVPDGQLPSRYDNPVGRRGMAFELVEAAARLGTVDHHAVGLEGLGKPDGWMERQVERWQTQLDGYLQLPGYSRPMIPNVDAVGRWLEANRPGDHHIGLVHGDLQFANVMFADDEVRLAAVIDWELATLGDPLLDLGWILASWHEPEDPPGHLLRVAPWRDFPSRAELIRHYEESSGRDTSAVPWFFVLACFKLGILLEGTYARAQESGTVPEVAQRLHTNAVWLLTKARSLTAC